MTTTEAIVAKLSRLPAEKQEQVLKYVETLESQADHPVPREDLGGLWAHLNLDITEEEIAEARREMWGNVPREDL